MRRSPHPRPLLLLACGLGLPLAGQPQPQAFRCEAADGRTLYQQAPCVGGLRLDLRTLNVLQGYRAPRAVAAAASAPLAAAVEIGPALRTSDSGRLQRL